MSDHLSRAISFIETLTLPDGRRLAETFPSDPWLVSDVLGPILATGEQGLPLHRLNWIELTRGSAKTSVAGAAVAIKEVLVPGTLVVCFASDYDQAAELSSAIDGQRRRNPKLAKVLTVAKDGFIVKKTGSRIRIMSSDAPSAYGLAADARRLRIVCDELTQWAKRDLFDAALTTLPKVRDAQLTVLTNAGIRGTWQEEARNDIERAGGYVFAPGGIQASWTDRVEVERLRHLLPKPVFARFYEGVWITGGAAFMTVEEVDAIFRDPQPIASAATTAYMGIDLGISRDRSAIAAIRASRGPVRVRVQELALWEGKAGNRVQLTEVQEAAISMARGWGVKRIVLDPYQGLQMAETLSRQGFVIEEYNFTSGRDRLFQMLLELVQQRRLKAAPHPVLREELERLQWRVVKGRVRPDHPVGGHDDAVMAVALAAWAAVGSSQFAPLMFGSAADFEHAGNQEGDQLARLLGRGYQHVGSGILTRWG